MKYHVQLALLFYLVFKSYMKFIRVFCNVFEVYDCLMWSCGYFLEAVLSYIFESCLHLEFPFCACLVFQRVIK